MTYEEVFDILSAIPIDAYKNIPCAYYQFPEDDPSNPAPPPPFLVYLYTGDDDLKADNINYQKIRSLAVELYCDHKDFALEAAVETALTANGFVYTKTLETYIKSERLYETRYETEVIITNG